MKQIYHCSACRYTFEAELNEMLNETFPARCLDCGKIAVLPADEAEVEEYRRIQAEIAAESNLKEK